MHRAHHMVTMHRVEGCEDYSLQILTRVSAFAQVVLDVSGGFDVLDGDME